MAGRQRGAPPIPGGRKHRQHRHLPLGHSLSRGARRAGWCIRTASAGAV